MRVRFIWQPEEWHEAVQLVTRPPRPHRDVPFMVYGVLGITCLGGLGDLVHFLQARQVESEGNLLLGGAFTAAAGSAIFWLTRTGLRRRRSRNLPPAPEGEQQAIFQESGWSTGPFTSTESLSLQPWSSLSNVRTGANAMVMMSSSGTFNAVPLRALSSDEAGHLQRLVARKLRQPLQEGLTTAAASGGC